MFSLKGKVALVTGASYGIGYAIAKGFAAAGATIVFNDIKQELVDKGIAAYKADGIDAHGYVCDVTDESAVNELVAKIEKEVGVIDILVNNAGIIKRIPMTEMSAAEFRQVIDVDLNAPFIVSKAVIPSMIKKGHGKIINICSMMSELGRETVSAYAAAKGGLKLLRSANSRPTAAVIRLIRSSLQKLRQLAGERPRILQVRQCSLRPTLQTSLTDMFCTLTAVSLHTSASSPNNKTIPNFCLSYHEKSRTHGSAFLIFI